MRPSPNALLKSDTPLTPCSMASACAHFMSVLRKAFWGYTSRGSGAGRRVRCWTSRSRRLISTLSCFVSTSLGSCKQEQQWPMTSEVSIQMRSRGVVSSCQHLVKA